jgi:DNA gyrase/topoisomerase IV subunit A
VDGLLAALENVDKVIDIVRKASDQSAAKTQLQKVLGTSETQTDAILRLQLGQLTRLNKGKLTEENAELEKSRMRVRRSFIRCNVTLGSSPISRKQLLQSFPSFMSLVASHS